MIAVGVDVARLGVMVVNNQPKSTAEYIQATSRVGRRAPGLVFTVLNWARPRDLSHYETFESFHTTIYQHVEALSVTPFADRAVDRGLTGVLAALVRNLKPDYNANRGAQWVDRRGEVVSHAVRSLELRAKDVTDNRHVANEVRARLDTRLDYWEQKRKAPGAVLGYRAARRQGDVAPLLLEPDSGPWRLMTCPTSIARGRAPDPADTHRRSRRRPVRRTALHPARTARRQRPGHRCRSLGDHMTAPAAEALRLGELRPSQLLHTYGIGAVTDLPNLSTMVRGLDDWDPVRARVLTEDRLLAAVRRRLGSRVAALRTPPHMPEDLADPYGEWTRTGVPVGLFPRWLRCSRERCNQLAPASGGLFQLKKNPYRPEKRSAGGPPARRVHTGVGGLRGAARRGACLAQGRDFGRPARQTDRRRSTHSLSGQRQSHRPSLVRQHRARCGAA